MLRHFRILVLGLTVLALGAVAGPSWRASALAAGQVAGARSSAPKAAEAPVFEWDHTWPKPLPNNWMLGPLSGVAVDAQDHIWVVHRPGPGAGELQPHQIGAALKPPRGECCIPAPPVIEFDQAGNVVSAWGGTSEGSYQWPNSEHGIFIDHTGDARDCQSVWYRRPSGWADRLGACLGR